MLTGTNINDDSKQSKYNATTRNMYESDGIFKPHKLLSKS